MRNDGSDLLMSRAVWLLLWHPLQAFDVVHCGQHTQELLLPCPC